MRSERSPRADLALARRGALVVRLLPLEVEEARAQHLHRLRAVLVLRAHDGRDDDAGRDVNDADAGIGGVGVLAAGGGGARGIDADVFRANFDIDVLRLGQHRHRRGRRVDAAARLRRRHALHAVDARFELQPREHALARDFGDDLLVAAGLAFALGEHLHLPAVQFGVALVHAE